MAEAAIIVLAGQSNMAGRGGVTRRQRDAPKCWDQVLPPECQSHGGDKDHNQTRHEMSANDASRLCVVQHLNRQSQGLSRGSRLPVYGRRLLNLSTLISIEGQFWV